VPNSAHWQERARAVEDRLSDALHDLLTQRFVDRRSAVLMRTLEGTGDTFGSVQADGEVVIDGHSVGRLEGFRFVPDPAETDAQVRLLHTAAQRTLGAEIIARAGRLRADQPTAFALDETGQILWRGNSLARIAPGHSVTAPRLVLTDNSLLEGSARIGVEKRLGAWLNTHLERTLAPLRKMDSDNLKGAARGLVYQVTEGLGSVPRPTVADQVAALAPKERSTLRSLGLRFGALTIYLPTMFRPDRAKLCCQLWALYNGLEPMPKPPTPGLVSLQAAPDVPSAYYAAAGYRVIGARAVRIDMLERLSLAVRRLAQKGPVKVSPELRMIIGCRPTEFDDVMTAIGFRKIDTVTGPAFEVVPRPRQLALAPPSNPAKRARSPFAVLAGHPALSHSNR
jgi:ATP-dependent RNA helicase SUPV3L1/SUV3